MSEKNSKMTKRKMGVLAGLLTGILTVVAVLVAVFVDFGPTNRKPEGMVNTYDDAYFTTLLSNRIDESRLEYSADNLTMTCTVTGFDMTLPSESVVTDFNKTLYVPSKLGDYTVTGIDFASMDQDEKSVVPYIRAVILPTTVESITAKSFMYFGALEYLETPFIGIKRGSSGYGMEDESNISYPLGSMFSEKNEQEQYVGYNYETKQPDIISYQIQWYETEPNGQTSCTYMVPGNLRRIVITDETVIGNHALFNLKSVSSIIIENSSSISQSGLRIGYYAIADNENLTYVSLPSENVSLSVGVFGRNPKLPSVTLPAGLIQVPEATFELCDTLETVIMPATVQTIGDGAFTGCTLLNSIKLYQDTDSGNPIVSNRDINLPTGLVSIGKNAFKACRSIREMYVPENVKFIGESAFDGCVALELISLPFVGAHAGGHLSDYCSSSSSDYKHHSLFGYIFGQQGSTGDGTYLAQQTYNSAEGGSTQFAIPSNLKTININGETVISQGAFQNLSSVQLLVLNDEITSIAQGAMNGMSSLNEISVPFVAGNSLGYMFAGAEFTGSDVTNASASYRVPGTLTKVKITNQPTIATGTFNNCIHLERVEISEATTTMQSSIFYNNPKLTTLVLPFVGICRGEYGERYMWWRDEAWRNTLQWLFSSTPHNDTYVNDSLRYYDGYRRYIPNSLRNVTITDETVIGTYSFRNFSSLESVSITNTVGSIAEYALHGCYNLKELTIPYVGMNANSTGESGLTHVLGWIFGRSAYSNSYAVSQYATFYIPKTLTSVRLGSASSKIFAYSFYGCNSLTYVSSSAEIVEMGTACFANCTKLGTLSIPNASYTSVADYAFQNCQQIRRITDFIPNTVKRINSYAFSGTSVGYGNQEIDLTPYTYVGPYAFSNCLQIESVTLPSTTTFGEGVFSGDQYLSKVDLSQNSNVTAYMFKNCTRLEEIDFSKVYNIPKGIFYGCSSLKYSKDGVESGFIQSDQTKSIGAYAFYGCQSLEDFTVYSTTKSIGSYAFSGCTGIPYMIMPKETTVIDANGWIGCDDNFFFYVYETEENWPSTWVENWNCDYPVYVIGHIDDSMFTYRYDTTYKKYFITGITSGTVLYGTVKLPSTHNGIKVIGVDDTNPDDIDTATGEQRISSQAGISKIILPKSISIIRGTPFATGNRVDIYTELTEAEVQKLYDTTDGAQGWDMYYTADGVKYASDETSLWTTAGLFYYKNYWTYGTGVAAETPYILSNALKFTLQTNFSYTYTGQALKPGVTGIQLPAVININDDLDVTSDLLTIWEQDTDIFDYYYSNNVSVGTAKITAKVNNTILNSKNKDYTIFPQNFPLLLSGDATISFKISKAVVNLYVDMSNMGTIDNLYMDRFCTAYTTTYTGTAWSNKDWGVYNVSGLYEVFSNAKFTGTLSTAGADAGTYLASPLAGQNGFAWTTAWHITRNGVDISANFTVQLNLMVVIEPMDVVIEFSGCTKASDDIYEYPYIGEYITPTAVAKQYKADGSGAVQLGCPVLAYNFTEAGFYPGISTFDMYAKLENSKNYRLVDSSGEPLVDNIILSNNTVISGVEGQYRVVKGTIYINFNYPDFVISPTADSWVNTTWNATNMTGLGPNSVFEGKMISEGDAKTSYSWGDTTGHGLMWQETTGTKGYTADFHIYNTKYSDSIDKPETADETAFYTVIVDDNARVYINYNQFNAQYYVGLNDDLDYMINRQPVNTSVSVDPDNGRLRVYIQYEVDGQFYRLTVDGVDATGNPYSADSNSSNYLMNYTVKYFTDLGQATTIAPLVFQKIDTYRIAVQLDARHFDTYFANIELEAIKSNVKIDSLTREYNGLEIDPITENKILKVGKDQTLTFTYYKDNGVYADSSILKPASAPLSTAPINAGKYIVHVVAEEGEYFNAVDTYIQFEITKRKISIDLSKIEAYDAVSGTTNAGFKSYDQKTVSYTPDNDALHLSGRLLSGDEITGVLYTVDSVAGVYDESKMSWVPAWQIFSTVSGEDVSVNYTVVLENSFTIRPLQFKGDAVLGFSSGFDDYYDGFQHSITVYVTYPTATDYYPAANGNYHIYYSLSPISATTDLSTCSIINYAFFQPGEYTVYFAITADNFESVYGSDEVIIRERTIDYYDPARDSDSGASDGDDVYTVDYNGQMQPYKITINDPWNAIVYYSTDGVSWTNVYPQYKEAGIYTVYYKIEAEFYETVGPKAIAFTIMEPSTELPTSYYSVTPYVGSYDGVKHSITVQATKPEGSSFLEVAYSLDNGITWTTENPSFVDAGEYTVSVRIIAQGYKTVYISSYVKIQKLSMHIAPVAYEGIYDGQYHNVSLSLSSDASASETLVLDTTNYDYGIYYYNGIALTYYYTTSVNVVNADTGWTQRVIFDSDGNVSSVNLGYRDTSINYVYVKLSAPNYEDLVIGYTLVKIDRLQNPTGEVPYQEFQYKKSPITKNDIQVNTIHDGVYSLYYYTALEDENGDLYYDANTCYPIPAPQELGNYYVVLEYLPSKNCAGMSISGYFRIVPRVLEVQWTKTFYYDGNMADPSPFVSSGTTDTINLVYQINGTIPAIEVGTYTYTVSMLEENENYVLDRTSIEIEILKKEIMVKFEITTEAKEGYAPWTQEDCIQYYNPNDSYAWRNLGLPLLSGHMFVATMHTSNGIKTNYYYTTLTNTVFINSVIVDWDIIQVDSSYAPITDSEGNTISVKEYYDVDFDIIVHIVNPSLDLTGILQDTVVTYDGYPHAISLNIPSTLSGALIFYKTEDGGWYTTPITYTLAGTYNTDFFIRYNGYEDTYGTAKLIIKKADLDIEIQPLPEDNNTYDAQKHTTTYLVKNQILDMPSAEGDYGHVRYYSAEEYTYEQLYAFYKNFTPYSHIFIDGGKEFIKDAGEYFCVVYYADALGRWNASFGIQKLTLKQRDIHISFPTDIYATPVYDGNKFSIPLAGATIDETDLLPGHMILSAPAQSTVRTKSADAGIYDPLTDFEFGSMWIAENDENVAKNYHPVLSAKSFFVKILKADLTDDMFIVEDLEREYNGQVAAPNVITPSDGKISYYFSYYTATGGTEECVPSDYQIDVNHYYVGVTIGEGKNYNAWTGGYKYADAIITPKQIDVKWSNYETVFNGRKQTPVAVITDNETDSENPIIVPLLVQFLTDDGLVDGRVNAGLYEGYASFNPAMAEYDSYVRNYSLRGDIHTFAIQKLMFNLQLGDGGTSNNIISYNTQSGWSKEIKTVSTPNYPDVLNFLNDSLVLEGGFSANYPIISTSGHSIGVYNTNDDFSVDFTCYTKEDGIDVTDSIGFEIIGKVTILTDQITYEITNKEFVYEKGTSYSFEDLKALTVLYPSNTSITQYQVTYQATEYTQPVEGNISTHLEDPVTKEERISNAGTYTIRFWISAPGYDTVDDIIVVTILKKDAYLAFTKNLGKVYDGTAVNPASIVSTSASGFNGIIADLTFSYYERVLQADGTYIENKLSEAPRDAGLYVVHVGSNADSLQNEETQGILDLNYTALDVTQVFEITPKKLDIVYDVEIIVSQANNNLNTIGQVWLGPVVAKYAGNTNLISGDMLEFQVKSDFNMRRGKYAAVATMYYKDTHEFTLTDRVNASTNDTFTLAWYIYKATGDGTEKELNADNQPIDITKNYYLAFDFNLNVHYPYINAIVYGGEFDYDGLSHSGSVDLSGVPSDMVLSQYYTTTSLQAAINHTNCVNDISGITFTEPGVHPVYYCLETDDYEPMTGTIFITIRKMELDETEVDSLDKVYDGLPAGNEYSGTNGTVYLPNFTIGTSNEMGKNILLDTSKPVLNMDDVKIEYQMLGSSKIETVGVSKVGTYQYRLTIPETTYFKEKIIIGVFTISQATIYIMDDIKVSKAFNSRVGTYEFKSVTTDANYILCTDKDNPASSLIFERGLELTATLVTKSSNAGIYSGSDASLDFLQQRYTLKDIITGEDVSENYLVSLQYCTYEIEKIEQEILDTTPAEIKFDTYAHTVSFAMVKPSTIGNTTVYYQTALGDWTTDAIYYTDTGEYPITVKLVTPNYNDLITTLTLKIVRAETTVTIADNMNQVYNGMEVTLPNTIFTNNTDALRDSYTFRYYKQAEDGNYYPVWEMVNGEGSSIGTGKRPIDAGKYRIEVEVPETKNFTGQSAYKDFEITALAVNIKWTGTQFIYDGTAKLPEAYLQISKADAEKGISVPLIISVQPATANADTAHKAVGAYIATAEIDTDVYATGNYSILKASQSCTFSITQREVEITVNQTLGYFGSCPMFYFDSSTGNVLTYTVSNIVSRHYMTDILVSKHGEIGIYAGLDNFDWQDSALNPVSSPRILDENGNNVTANYAIKYNLKLVINTSELSYSFIGGTYTYDGKQHSAALTINTIGNFNVFYSEDGVSWSTTNFEFTEAGTYPVYVKIEDPDYITSGGASGFETAISNTVIQINKKVANLDFAKDVYLDKVYDAVAVENPEVVYDDMDILPRAIHYTYKRIYDGNEIETNFVVNAGEYHLIISIDGAENYENGTLDVYFTIAKRDITICVAPATKTFDYTPWMYTVAGADLKDSHQDRGIIDGHVFEGIIQTVSANVGEYATAERFKWHNGYKIYDNVPTQLNPKGTEVTDNYAVHFDLNVTISKAQMKVSVSPYQNSYDGKAHSVTVSILGTIIDTYDAYGNPVQTVSSLMPSNYAIYYTADPETMEYTTTPVTRTAVGTTTVYIWITADNYEDFRTSSTISITSDGSLYPDPDEPIDPTPDGEDPNLMWSQNYVYNGNAYPTPYYTVGDRELQKVMYYETSDTMHQNPLSAAPVDAGEYVFVLTVPDMNDPLERTFTIEKKGIVLTWNDTMLPENGSEQLPTASFVDVFGNTVSSANSSDLTVSSPQTLPGSYIVTAMLSGAYDQNYTIKNPRVTFKIYDPTDPDDPNGPSGPDGPKPDTSDPNLIWDQNFIYCGQPYTKPYYITAFAGEQTVVYYEAVDTLHQYPLSDTPVDAGNYIFVLTVPGLDTPVERNFTIQKKSITLDWTKLKLPYTGLDQLPEASFKDVFGNTVSSSDTTAIRLIQPQTAAGTYEATAYLLGDYALNYMITDPNAEFTIGVTEIDDFVLYSPLQFVYGEEVVIKDSVGNTYIINNDASYGTLGEILDILNPDGASIFTEELPYILIVDYGPDAGKHPVIAQLKDTSNTIWKTSGESNNLSYTYDILPLSLPNEDYDVVVYFDDPNPKTYTGNIIKPTVSVKLVHNITGVETMLVLGTDFTVSYPGEDNNPNDTTSWDWTNINITTANALAKAYVKGAGNYTFDKTLEFAIISGIPQVLTIKSAPNIKLTFMEIAFDSTMGVTIVEDGSIKHTQSSDANLYLGHIHQNTLVSQVLEQLDNELKYLQVSYYDYDGNLQIINPENYSSTYIGTGYRISLYDGEDFENSNMLDSMQTIIFGDLNGDGFITDNDITEIYQVTTGEKGYDNGMTDAQYFAGIVDRDNLTMITDNAATIIGGYTTSIDPFDFNQDYVYDSAEPKN